MSRDYVFQYGIYQPGANDYAVEFRGPYGFLDGRGFWDEGSYTATAECMYRTRRSAKHEWRMWRNFTVNWCPLRMCWYCGLIGSRRWIRLRLEMQEAFGFEGSDERASVCARCWRKSRFASIRRAVRSMSEVYDNERLIRKIQREIAKCRKAPWKSEPPAS
jgi:hypothetical protein